jgi:hypothetical protein
MGGGAAGGLRKSAGSILETDAPRNVRGEDWDHEDPSDIEDGMEPTAGGGAPDEKDLIPDEDPHPNVARQILGLDDAASSDDGDADGASARAGSQRLRDLLARVDKAPTGPYVTAPPPANAQVKNGV